MRPRPAAESASAWVLGVDSGGSGLRVALARAGDGKRMETVVSHEPVRTGPRGIDAGHLLEQLLPAARALIDRTGAQPPVAAAVGAAGMATLGKDLRATLPGALARALGVQRLALTADAVAAYAGALGQRPGAVVAAGTGLIALGVEGDSAAPGDDNLTPAARSLSGPPSPPSGRSDEDRASGRARTSGRWRRADGWGHLLGDSGSGAWIGRAGLEAALRAYDGRTGGSPALLARLKEVFGPVPGLPGLLYPRTDRPAVLASFAPEVARCAPDDAAAAGILREAARHIADAAAAVCPASSGCEVGLTGGLFLIGEPLLAPLRAELAQRLPHARPLHAEADPLDGALCVAAALARDDLRLPVDQVMLHLPQVPGPLGPLPYPDGA